MNIWSLDPISASLLDLDVNFGEVLELNLRALPHSSWSCLTFPQLHGCSNDTAESKNGKKKKKKDLKSE